MDRRSARDEDDRGGRRGGRGNDRDDSRRGGSSRREYKPRSSEQVRKRQEESSGGDFDKYFLDSIKVFKPHDKDNVIRIIEPTWDDAEHYGYDIWLHYKVGPDEQAYLCLNKMKGEPCPLCEERQRAAKAGEDDEYLDSLKPKPRVVVALVDRDNEKEGVQFWPMPAGVDRDLLSRTTDKRSGEILRLDDPDEGYDVEFTKEGQGLKTKYVGIGLSRRSSPLGKEAWRDFVYDNPIPKVLKFYSYDHILSEFGGGAHSSKVSKSYEDERSARGRDLDREQDDDLRKVETRSSRRDEQELDWDGVHSMSYEELSALIETKDLKIKANESKHDEELADWICEDLDIKKRPKRSDDDGDGRKRLADMRGRRD